MSDQDALQALLNEAELYQSQGLLVESKERFSQALDFMKEKKVRWNDYRVFHVLGTFKKKAKK